MNARGYSLVEMMVVVAIIGILASIAGPNYKVMSDRARATQVRKTFSLMTTSAELIHKNGDRVVQATWPGTLTGCSVCYTGYDLSIPPKNYTTLANVDYAWKVMGFEPAPRDPWGNPYLMDENDEDFGATDYRFDAVWSAGPDGLWAGSGDGDDVNGDDLIVRFPFRNPSRCPTASNPANISPQYGAPGC